MLGRAMLIGGTGHDDWPLEPVEVVEGVPFMSVRGYFLSGKAESSEQYLSYCLANCDWTGFRYATKTAAEQTNALDKLIRSNKWKRPLKDYERDFLTNQVR
jgi:hypothetical protein